jgi:hypothetical protein
MIVMVLNKFFAEARKRLLDLALVLGLI